MSVRLLPKEGWRYAALLVLLFAIAAVATREVIRYIETRIPAQEILAASAIVASLTLGLMLIAGAFGLWAIRFSAEAESIRRIGGLVDHMHYIRDGVIAVNRHGIISGVNPAATDLFGDEIRHGQPIEVAFPTLTENDCRVLRDEHEPCEVERDVSVHDTRRSLRFRSQPAQGTTIILISDITHMVNDRLRRRQNAYLQLLGHIARGVANDFNDLLCGISGHAAIIRRSPKAVDQVILSAASIESGAERGLRLAGHLIELAAAGKHSHATAYLDKHVRGAMALLGDGLEPDWTIELDIGDTLPPVGLSGPQVEQVVHSLGLLATDVAASVRRLTVLVRPSSDTGLTAGTPTTAVVVILATVPRDRLDTIDAASLKPPEEAGVLESVVAAMLSEADGQLEVVRPAHNMIVYRVRLPHATDLVPDAQDDFPEELAAYMADWRLLIAGPPHRYGRLAAALSSSGPVVETANDIATALARVERAENLAAILVDREILGTEADGLLRAIAKLCPAAGIVVLSAGSGETPSTSAPLGELRGVVTADADAPIAHLRRLIIEARTIATRRVQG